MERQPKLVHLAKSGFLLIQLIWHRLEGHLGDVEVPSRLTHPEALRPVCIGEPHPLLSDAQGHAPRDEKSLPLRTAIALQVSTGPEWQAPDMGGPHGWRGDGCWLLRCPHCTIPESTEVCLRVVFGGGGGGVLLGSGGGRCLWCGGGGGGVNEPPRSWLSIRFP